MVNPTLRQQITQFAALPLRIEAKTLAEGYRAGLHRATTKGSGVEFAGHRPYTPGDDLRHLDRHAQLRHNRLLIRQFQTETERALHVVCDVSTSMAYADPSATASRSKLDLALLLTASLLYLAGKAGDEPGLTLIDGHEAHTILGKGRTSGLEHMMLLLEEQRRPALLPSSLSSPPQAPLDPEKNWSKALHFLGDSLRRGAIVVLVSDFLDLTPAIATHVGQLASLGRTLRAVQVLTRSEVTFPFEGAAHFIDPETGAQVRTDAEKVKSQYDRALLELTSPLRSELKRGGGSFLRVVTDEAPDRALAQLASGLPLKGDQPWG